MMRIDRGNSDNTPILRPMGTAAASTTDATTFAMTTDVSSRTLAYCQYLRYSPNAPKIIGLTSNAATTNGPASVRDSSDNQSNRRMNAPAAAQTIARQS